MKTTVHKQKCTYMPADTEEKTQANQRNKESTWKKKIPPHSTDEKSMLI